MSEIDHDSIFDELVGEVSEDDGPEAPAEDSAEATGQVEQQGDEESPAEGASPEGSTVPLAALHEAREANRELRERIADLEKRADRSAEIQRRLDEMASAPKAEVQNAPPPEQPLPDKDEDPVGYMEGLIRRLESKLEETDSKASASVQQQEETQQQNALFNAIAADTNAVLKDEPAFQDALNFVRGEQYREMVEFAGVDPETAVKNIQVSELSMAQTALANGKSPAQIILARAKRSGWTPDSSPAEGGAENAEGEQIGGDKPAALEEVNDLDDAASMGSGGGPTVQDLMEANEDEFDQMFKELGYGERMS